MILIARYRTVCCLCDGLIQPGDEIEWYAGRRNVIKAMHLACA
jgi:hypothetical protein